MDDYPRISTLKEIRSYDLVERKTVKPLLGLIKKNWKYADIGYFSVRRGKSNTGKSCIKLQLHTGGWSGNEDIISAIEETKFPNLFMFWTKSEVGGHYYFDIPIEFYLK